MLLSVPIEEFNIDFIHYMKSKKNIIMNGLFTKILYSDSDIVMNGLFIRFTIKIQTIQNQLYYILDEMNQDIIKSLIHLENDILLYYKILLHQSQMKSICYLKGQLEKGFLKFKVQHTTTQPVQKSVTQQQQTMECIMKISGVWQNVSQIGLNFKVVSMN